MLRLASLLLSLASLVTTVKGQSPNSGQPSLYANSDVIEADAAMLKEMERSGGAFVVFYAPWCGHCHKIVPEVVKAASQLKSKGIRVAALNSDGSPGLAQSIGIRGFPSIRWMDGGNGGKGEDYKGPRTALEMVQFASQCHVLSQVKAKVSQGVEAVKSVGKLALSKIAGRQAQQQDGQPARPSAQGMGVQPAAVPAAAAA